MRTVRFALAALIAATLAGAYAAAPTPALAMEHCPLPHWDYHTFTRLSVRDISCKEGTTATWYLLKYHVWSSDWTCEHESFVAHGRKISRWHCHTEDGHRLTTEYWRTAAPWDD